MLRAQAGCQTARVGVPAVTHPVSWPCDTEPLNITFLRLNVPIIQRRTKLLGKVGISGLTQKTLSEHGGGVE